MNRKKNHTREYETRQLWPVTVLPKAEEESASLTGRPMKRQRRSASERLTTDSASKDVRVCVV